MPKVYLLPDERKKAALERQNEVFACALRTAKGRLRRTDDEISKAVGISRASLIRMKHAEHVGSAGFQSVRAVAHEIKMTPDEWLRLGGFKEG